MPIYTAVIPMDSGNFETTITGFAGLTLVDFSADWCPCCQELAPIYEQLAIDYHEQVNFGRVDTDASRELAQAHGISGIPAVLAFRGSTQELERVVGCAGRRRYVEMIERLKRASSPK